MRVLELLEEIEEIVDTSSGLPLTGKIMVDANEMLEIVKDIRTELPDEIQQAQWIKNERDRILDEAKTEYETIIRNAEKQAEELVENDKIVTQARERATELMERTQDSVRQLKMSTYDYVDRVLFNFQEKMDELSTGQFNKMFQDLETSFQKINTTLAANRDEIKEMAYKTSVNMDEQQLRQVKAAAAGESQEGTDYEDDYYDDEND